jgi:hypothetical protein
MATGGLNFVRMVRAEDQSLHSELVLQACTRQEYVVLGGRAVAGAALEL